MDKPISNIIRNGSRAIVSVKFSIDYCYLNKRDMVHVGFEESLFLEKNPEFPMEDIPDLSYNYLLTPRLARWSKFEKAALDDILNLDGIQYSLHRKNLERFLKENTLRVVVSYMGDYISLERRSAYGDLINDTDFKRQGERWVTLFPETTIDDELLSLILVDGKPITVSKE